MFCIKCGNKIEGEMKFCPKCGAELPIIENKSNSNNGVQINTAPTVNTKNDDANEKKNVFVKLLPVIAIVLVLVLSIAFLASKSGSKNKVSDLAELIDYSEEQIADFYGCDVNEFGFYPNDDNIIVTCIDGRAYTVSLRSSNKDADKYTIKGISVGKTIEEVADMLDLFTEDYTSDVVDGVRHLYTEKATGYMLMIDVDTAGKIIGISYSWDNSTVEDVSENDSEEVILEESTEESTSEEIKENESQNDIGYQLPQYCGGLYGDEYDGKRYLTHFVNEQSGYVFGLTDTSSNRMYIKEVDKFNELVTRMAELSNYTEVEIVIFEENEVYNSLDDVLDNYLDNNYLDYRSLPAFIILAEFYNEDGSIDYCVDASDSIHNRLGEYGFNDAFNQINGKPSISLAFVESFTNVLANTNDMSANYTGYSDEYLCELASLYYGICHDCTQPMADVDSVNGNMVTIQLWEGMDDQRMTCDWYTVDRTTGCGYDVRGEEIDITVVERYLGDVGDTTQ